jgi:hypothetical protein
VSPDCLVVSALDCLAMPASDYLAAGTAWLAAAGGDRRQHVRGKKRLYRSCEKRCLRVWYTYMWAYWIFDLGLDMGLDNIGWVFLTLEGRCSTGASLFGK